MEENVRAINAKRVGERLVRKKGRCLLDCEKVHKDKIEQGKLDMIHVQADEIWVKARGTIAWMGLAIMVPTRLWVAGVVSQTRERKLADQLLQQVRRASKTLCDLLICTDGWSPYPNSIKRFFREKIERAGKRGRCSLVLQQHLGRETASMGNCLIFVQISDHAFRGKGTCVQMNSQMKRSEKLPQRVG